MDENKELVQEFTQEGDHLFEEWEISLSDFDFKTANLEEFLGNLMRILHTIKGTAACVGLNDFSQGIHKIEDFYTNLKKNNSFTPDNLNLSFFIYSKMFEYFEIIKKTLVDSSDCTQCVLDVFSGKNKIEDKESKSQSSKPTQLESVPKDKGATEKVSSPQVAKVKDKLSIEYDLIDTIAKLNGEMTVIRSTLTKSLIKLKQSHKDSENVGGLEDINAALNSVSTEMMRQISNLKLVSLQSFFRTIKRLVRDTSIKLGKKVSLNILGDQLYVDVKISKALSAICVHMIRNSLDHGLEQGEVRIKNGKDPSGNINLFVEEDGESYKIEISDDGKGLDPNFILGKAKEKGLIQAGQEESMSKDEILNLIFENGFSTSTEVSDLSGRGVGMDMVRTTINDLKGKISIQSELGVGTKFTLDVPKPKSVEILSAIRVNSYDTDLYIGSDEILKIINCNELSDHSENLIRKIEENFFFLYDEDLIPIVPNLFDSSAELTEKLDYNFLLIINIGGSHYCLPANNIHEFEDVFVRPLNKVVNDITGIYRGCCIIENHPYLILDGEKVKAKYIKKVNVKSSSEKSSNEGEIDRVDYLRFEWNNQKYLVDSKRITFIVEKEADDIQDSFGSYYFRHLGNYNSILSIGQNQLNYEIFKKKNIFLLLENGDDYSAVLVDKVLDLVSINKDQIEHDLLTSSDMSGTIYFESNTYQIINLEEIMKRRGRLDFSFQPPSHSKAS